MGDFIMMKLSQRNGSIFKTIFPPSLGLTSSIAIAEGTEKVSGNSYGSMLWFSFVSLMLGAALILLLAWLVRRNSALQQPYQNSKILLQHSLGTRERVIVLKILNRVLVLGQTPTQINLLTELDPEEISELIDPLPPMDMVYPFSKFFKVNKQ
jgi:flagellar protein FliO/FliZ